MLPLLAIANKMMLFSLNPIEKQLDLRYNVLSKIV